MPLPWLIAGVAALTGLYGAKKHIDASDNNDAAKWLINDSREKYEETHSVLEERHNKLQKSLKKLGNTKIDIQLKQIRKFTSLYSRFKHVAFAGDVHLDSFGKTKDFNERVKEMEVSSMNLQEVMLNTGGSLAAGAVAGIAAYGGVGLFGAASTGTAIAGLSGAAATNATLAWLGGGSLAAGGLGIAGGTAVLGGIVLAPVLAVSGLLSAAKSEENLAKARAQAAKVKKTIEQMKTIIVFCEALISLSEDYNKFLIWFQCIFDRYLDDFAYLANNAEVDDDGHIDFRKLTIEQQQIIQLNRLIVQIMWKTLKTPLLEGENHINEQAEILLEEGYSKAREIVENMQAV